jgi:mono/diheme cytochrome c family protein
MSRIQIEITLGILLILATSTLILVYGLNENNRMAEFEESQRGQAIEVGADLFDQQCSRCHGTQGTGIPGLCPPLNDRYFFDHRLEEVGWSGSLEDYIVATASSGRLASTRPEQFPGQGTPAMPSFSEQYGGPLREDQIRSIATYIMNWEETATAVLPPPTPSGPPTGTDINKELPEGDPAAGETLSVAIGCTACHIAAPTGPAWLPAEGQPGIGDRAASRPNEPEYTGEATTADQYLHESIVLPAAYLVPGYTDLMPHTYGSSLTDQDLADIIAYLLTLK